MIALLYAVAAGLVVATASIVEKTGLTSAQPYAGLFVRTGAIAAVLAVSLVPLSKYVDWAGLDGRTIFFLGLGGVLAGLVAHFLYGGGGGAEPDGAASPGVRRAGAGRGPGDRRDRADPDAEAPLTAKTYQRNPPPTDSVGYATHDDVTDGAL